MIDVAAYTRRIGYEGPLAPTPGTLRALHVAHMRAVPFENLDIHLGRPIVLSTELLVHKVVADRRGGFCYELNGAFAALLQALGFGVSPLSAGVMGAEGFGPPFDHMALEVTCPGDPGPWLVDVGFGDGFVEPLRLAVGVEQAQPNGTYRIDEEEGLHVLRRRTPPEDAFAAQFRFGREAHELSEYAARCRYHQTSPDSSFTRRRVCSMATPEGRVTLTEQLLIVTRGGLRDEAPVGDDAAYRALLRERFGIEVTGAWLR